MESYTTAKSNKRSKKIQAEEYSDADLRSCFHINDTLFEKWFEVYSYEKEDAKGKLRPFILKDTLERICMNDEFQRDYEKELKDISPEDKWVIDQIKEDLINSSLVASLQECSQSSRHYILHVGPTNSGKTFNAIQALRQCKQGVYLGPLRLLALEIFDTLNQSGTNCSLLTGEESIEIPFSTVVSSTVEMLDLNTHYDVAVIDEAQCIANITRGSRWSSAIFQIDADEIHLCLAPEAEYLLTSLLSQQNEKFEVKHYERLAPLVFEGSISDISEIRAGDALIAFSRRKVLALAADLEERGVKTSVIYGNLPPDARREEVRRFNSGESRVVIATDAIGMGVSLPIKRIIFTETEKYNGYDVAELTASEIKQIAGRAGRFGKFESGEVLTMKDPELIKNALDTDIEDIRHITLPFPKAKMTNARYLKQYIKQWNKMLPFQIYLYEDMRTAEILLGKLKKQMDLFDISTLMKLITCPFDCNDRRLLWYWHSCCDNILNGDPIPLPTFEENDLEGCEVQYKAYELAYRLVDTEVLRQQISQEKAIICEKINRLLLADKANYLARCQMCGRRLKFNENDRLCQKCRNEVNAQKLKEAFEKKGFRVAVNKRR